MQELLELGDKETWALWNHLRLSYTETKGLPQLRHECAKQAGLAEENVIMFAGAEEGIFCALNTILTPNDHAIVFTPCYQSLYSIPDAICSTTQIDLRASEGWRVDVEAVARAIQPGRTKVIVMNFPHNPTGTHLPPATLEALVALARTHDLWLFCDEVYRGIERLSDDERCVSVAQAYEKGIALSAVSKSHGLPGLRVGWLVAQDTSLLEAISGQKHYLSICSSAPSEVLALIAVRYRHKLWQRNQSLVEANLALFEAFLARHPDQFSWTRPTGGCCGFVRVHLPSSTTKAEEKLGEIEAVDSLSRVAERLVQAKGLLLLPGVHFPSSSSQRGEISAHMRIGLGRRNFPQVLQVLEEALSEGFFA